MKPRLVFKANGHLRGYRLPQLGGDPLHPGGMILNCRLAIVSRRCQSVRAFFRKMTAKVHASTIERTSKCI
jgi:hypothetical protein